MVTPCTTLKPTHHSRRDLGCDDACVVVDGPALDEQALRHAGDLLIKAGHQVVNGLSA